MTHSIQLARRAMYGLCICVLSQGVVAGFALRRSWILCLLLAAGCAGEPASSPDPLPAQPLGTLGARRGNAARPAQPDVIVRPNDAADEFFQRHPVVELRLQIDEAQVHRLREEPRQYVRATLVEEKTTTYTGIGVKLKGAAGSFQGFDDRPALTLNMNKFHDQQTFHALDKFHLNNSVQDESYACEQICSELCQQAGLPATRVAHARVWINDRDLGLYVLKEGFDKHFVRRNFEKSNGNLYDGGFLLDIDADLEKDLGDGPNDFSDLQSLASACREPNPGRRWALIENTLDVDSFITFMAIELMTCHWDGYTRNRNNFRIYFDPTDGKARFLPHGMDQMFSDPGFSILEYSDPIVSAAVMQNPNWRKRYRQQVQRLLPIFSAAELTKSLDSIRNRLQPTLAAVSEDADRHHADVCRDLRERLVARAENLREQINQPDPSPVEFDEQGQLALEDWEPRQETEDAQLDRVEQDGKVAFVIEVGPSGQCVASWRRKVLLAQGRYRLVARVHTEAVDSLANDQGSGAGVRISGANRPHGIQGTTVADDVTFEFTVEEPSREVELVAELRATRGRAVFESPLRVVRVSPP